MKNSALTLAILGLFAGSASAQSTVTIYGLVDLGVSKLNNGTSFLTGLPVGLTGTPDTWNMRPSTSSRLGFRGNEDLGGGLKANFSIEHRLDASTGTEQSGQGGMWRGHSWVGLSSTTFGEVRLGRMQNPALYVAQRGDPWSWDYNVGSVQVINRAGNGVTYAANSALYITPNFNGIQGMLQVGLGEGGVTAASPSGNTDRTLGANLTYLKGPWYAGVGYNEVRVQNSPNENKYLVVTGTYDFGPIKPILQYTTAKNVSTVTSKSYTVGATAPLAAGFVKAVASRYDPAGANNTTTKVGLGYEYFLSKRTSLHADVGSGKTQGLTRTTGFEAGMKHQF
ncbi:porin [soil metagenome]